MQNSLQNANEYGLETPFLSSKARIGRLGKVWPKRATLHWARCEKHAKRHWEAFTRALAYGLDGHSFLKTMLAQYLCCPVECTYSVSSVTLLLSLMEEGFTVYEPVSMALICVLKTTNWIFCCWTVSIWLLFFKASVVEVQKSPNATVFWIWISLFLFDFLVQLNFLFNQFFLDFGSHFLSNAIQVWHVGVRFWDMEFNPLANHMTLRATYSASNAGRTRITMDGHVCITIHNSVASAFWISINYVKTCSNTTCELNLAALSRFMPNRSPIKYGQLSFLWIWIPQWGGGTAALTVGTFLPKNEKKSTMGFYVTSPVHVLCTVVSSLDFLCVLTVCNYIRIMRHPCSHCRLKGGPLKLPVIWNRRYIFGLSENNLQRKWMSQKVFMRIQIMEECVVVTGGAATVAGPACYADVRQIQYCTTKEQERVRLNVIETGSTVRVENALRSLNK